LEDPQRIEDVSHLYLIVLKICHDVWVGNEDLHNLISPLNHLEVLIVITIQVHVK
jgi:hypothetical protein